ncbi:GIY-YIG nuclease family protein [Candidatus Gracilibacteria bacterium]|nr:GIY-YIG nuclease family protein [Candidatus Gracilibacteria bacterium]
MHKPGYVYVYMTTNEKNGILYVGITNNILQKIVDHKFGLVEGLAKKYGLNTCIYYEFYADMDVAMAREKELKGWSREQKIELLESKNPEWADLKEEIKKLK